MNNHAPIIFTERTECQDCFKCIRECPVKAIKVENACAAVIPQLCVLCGHCVEVCPNGAKHVRDDLDQARQLLKEKDQVFASLAPSFVSEFPDIPPSAIIRALKKLGFAGVSETALGAERVSGSVAGQLRDKTPRVIISTACPVVVNYLGRYHPQYAECLSPYVSPVLAHCQLLRETYGPSIGIVFFSPCIAKKGEADNNSELLDIALTFEDMRRWLQLEQIAFQPGRGDEESFVPYSAQEGALYPIDGGMVAGVKAGCSVMEAECMSFSGIRNIQKAMADLGDMRLTHPIFLELLACEGGCVNGPKANRRKGTILKRSQIIQYARYPQEEIPRPPTAPVWGDALYPDPVPRPEYSDKILRQTLQAVGKYGPEDELNCGGCGYDNCREFARALIDCKAEKVMCVAYMRKLAQKKTNALMEKTPSAIVLVDEELKIIECNYNFAKIIGPDAENLYDEQPGLEGVFLHEVAPFYSLFKTVLEKGEDILNRDLRYKKSVLHIDIFSIEQYRVVCGIFQDITSPTIHKEAMIQKAQDVIKKNLATVQQIAYLLGENAAESEVILNSIIHSMTSPELE
ncbi:MAG TPA: [Fe-Fe] hydrogenase large subunit C-terminal domain-containing protein [Syntrophobacter fumaroxidans]|nr:[Fe-Fe] hydrogenase large subunit C-terminal domain-containing protein [Syntrophobacter fumaroxidans]